LGHTEELQVEIIAIIPSLLSFLGNHATNGGENAISTLIELAENGWFQPDITAANLKENIHSQVSAGNRPRYPIAPQAP
jgi:hypothetical protein